MTEPFYVKLPRYRWRVRVTDEYIYPCTITCSRYGGLYEHDQWFAVPYSPEEVPMAATGDDIECMEWHHDPPVPVGFGPTPQEAYSHLRAQLAAMKEPTT